MSNRSRTRVRTLSLPVMPDRTITFLTIAAGALFALYVMLVITTIAFATTQTSLAVQVRETEGKISALETTYYASVARDNASTPASLGLVHPTEVEYAVAKPASGLSFVGK